MPAECGQGVIVSLDLDITEGAVTTVTVVKRLAIRAPLPLATLTEREAQALILITAGLSLAEVAKALSVAQSTVRTYSSRIIEVFGLHNSRGAATLALLSGTVTAEQVAEVWAKWRPWLVE